MSDHEAAHACPQESQLEDYALDRAPAEVADAVEIHLLLCPRCADWVLCEVEFRNAFRKAVEQGMDDPPLDRKSHLVSTDEESPPSDN